MLVQFQANLHKFNTFVSVSSLTYLNAPNAYVCSQVDNSSCTSSCRRPNSLPNSPSSFVSIVVIGNLMYFFVCHARNSIIAICRPYNLPTGACVEPNYITPINQIHYWSRRHVNLIQFFNYENFQVPRRTPCTAQFVRGLLSAGDSIQGVFRRRRQPHHVTPSPDNDYTHERVVVDWTARAHVLRLANVYHCLRHHVTRVSQERSHPLHVDHGREIPVGVRTSVDRQLHPAGAHRLPPERRRHSLAKSQTKVIYDRVAAAVSRSARWRDGLVRIISWARTVWAVGTTRWRPKS